MLIKLGSTGEKVLKIQTLLGLKADGKYGPITESKVKAWQQQQGLIPDGIVGQATWSKMFSPDATSDTLLNLQNLHASVPADVVNQIGRIADSFNITTNLRLSHFLAQCATESGNFRLVVENLNYSVIGLKRTFGKYFPGNLAESYAHKPEKIASRVYGNRLGNGSEESKDGWNYRGRGYIQLTGKSNYAQLTKFVGEDCVANPDLVSTKYPLASAAFFFNHNNIWKLCDAGSSIAAITKVSEAVNGGHNGLSERLQNFNKYYSILHS